MSSAALDTLEEIDPLDPLACIPLAGGCDGPPFSTIRQGLADLADAGPEHLSKDSLREDLRWLAEVQRSVEALSARWLAELDRRTQEQPWTECDGSLTEWLGKALRLTPGAAYAQVRTARTLDALPATARAFGRGELSAQQVSVICRAMDEVHRGRVRIGTMEAEMSLLSAAGDRDPRELNDYWKQVRYRADQEAGLEAEEEQRRQRWLNLRQTWSGRYVIEGELDAESGATLRTALSGLMGRRSSDDERSPEQRRADALVELARRRLDAGDLPERGGERPHLTVVAELSTLRLEPGSKLADLDWGALVTGETARRIGCDCSITPVVVDEDGEILHVGRRTRSVPAPTRRALNLRDRHCQGPGCEVLPPECTPHHIVHWADGGSDELPNLRLYCSLCRRRHNLHYADLAFMPSWPVARVGVGA